MNYFLKEKLKDRLQYCLDWQKNAETYLFHKSITNEVDKNFYSNKPIIRILINIYFLPTNLLRFIRLMRFYSFFFLAGFWYVSLCKTRTYRGE